MFNYRFYLQHAVANWQKAISLGPAHEHGSDVNAHGPRSSCNVDIEVLLEFNTWKWANN